MAGQNHKGNCLHCESQCLDCENKLNHHRGMETKHYKQELTAQVPVETLIQILEECVLMSETRQILNECLQEA